jgi:starch synthase (maltosyl-transferring)
VILTVVNLDHRYAQSGWVTMDLPSLGLDAQVPCVAHDLLSDAHYVWDGGANYVKLDPADVPCHVFLLSQPGAPTKPAAP